MVWSAPRSSLRGRAHGADHHHAAELGQLDERAADPTASIGSGERIAWIVRKRLRPAIDALEHEKVRPTDADRPRAHHYVASPSIGIAVSVRERVARPAS